MHAIRLSAGRLPTVNGPTPLHVGEPFNPYGRFFGIFTPEGLVRNPNVSAGAKMAYRRLARYTGADGSRYLSGETLARKMGVKERQAQCYLAEWEANAFIRRLPKVKSWNTRDTNSFLFLWHAALSWSPLQSFSLLGLVR